MAAAEVARLRTPSQRLDQLHCPISTRLRPRSQLLGLAKSHCSKCCIIYGKMIGKDRRPAQYANNEGCSPTCRVPGVSRRDFGDSADGELCVGESGRYYIVEHGCFGAMPQLP